MSRLVVPVIAALIAVTLIFFKPEYNDLVLQWIRPPRASCLPQNETLFTPEQLKQFDGHDSEKGVYLSFLGIVYDVSRGIKHYGPGGTYSVFAGRDATRAFVTGDFDVDHAQDDVSDLETSAFSGIREWAAFYQKDYLPVGRLIGSYYDSRGCPTSKLEKVHAAYQELDRQANDQKLEEDKYPPCNSVCVHTTVSTQVVNSCLRHRNGLRKSESLVSGARK